MCGRDDVTTRDVWRSYSRVKSFVRTRRNVFHCTLTIVAPIVAILVIVIKFNIGTGGPSNMSLPLVQDIKATNQGFRFVSRCWLTRIDNLNLLHK